MIVDCHVNVYEDSQILPLYGQIAGIARAGGFTIKSDPPTVEAAMKDVNHAIVFSLRYKDLIGIDGDDEVTARLVKRDPKKFIGFAAVDPRMPNCMELLEHAVEDLGLKGVKFGPIYNGVSLLDPRLVPVYEYLQRKNLPLTMHMGTTYGQNAPIAQGRPLDVDTIASRYPDLKMIMAHMGHPWYEECIVVARKNPERLLRGFGALLPAVAVLQHSGLRAGIQHRCPRQDLFRHGLPVHDRRGFHRGLAQDQRSGRRHAPAARRPRHDRPHHPFEPAGPLVAWRSEGLTPHGRQARP